MIALCRKLLRKIINEYCYFVRKFKYKKPKNIDASIISDNCLAGSIYKSVGAKFNSPTIGLFIPGADFCRLSSSLNEYMSYELIILEESRYAGSVDYPLGLLKDVELHFLHYDSFSDAKAAWDKRKKRIDYDNVFFTMTDRDWTLPSHRDAFLSAGGKRLFFSSNKIDNPKVVWCKRYSGLHEIGIITTNLEFIDYFDVASWLED